MTTAQTERNKRYRIKQTERLAELEMQVVTLQDELHKVERLLACLTDEQLAALIVVYKGKV